jgi:large subunit ribosomal protein L7Ae
MNHAQPAWRGEKNMSKDHFDVPAELKEKQTEFLQELVKKKGKYRIGVNEVTKAIERDTAKLVFLAKDVSPAELTMHIPLLCKEKKVPFTFVETRKDLGSAIGIGVGAAAIAIVEAGDAQQNLEQIVKKVQALSK